MKTSLQLAVSISLAGLIRGLLMVSNFADSIQSRVEISTPLNSWKRVKEGAFLFDQGVSPYSGDLYHNSPLVLITTNALIKYIPNGVAVLFVLLDLLAGFSLFCAASKIVKDLRLQQKGEEKSYAKGVDELLIKTDDETHVPMLALIAYLFNPYSILNCVGQTTTVFSNLILGLFLLCLAQRKTFPAVVLLVLEVQQNLYPIALIVPLILQTATFSSDGRRNNKLQCTTKACLIVLTFCGVLFAFSYANFVISRGSWDFLDSTYGFILGHRDLQPNIGLFWYFFTEMFDHFRVFFLYTFQMNALVLYLIPLSLKFRKEPLFLATLLISLSAIFRSYPCVGDVAFYMALLPIWKHVSKFMTHNFIVGCFFLVTSFLGPVVWHLWIYSASANANFYFGVTLSFATAQIFLVTDMLFAHIKRRFYLFNGMECKLVDGTEAKIALE